MIKRLLLVLAVIAGIIFVPYWVGKLVIKIWPDPHISGSEFWLPGIFACMVLVVVLPIIYYTIVFIVTGDWD